MKLRRANKILKGICVVGKVLHYSGSIELSAKNLKKTGMLPGEKIRVFNRTNGAVFETYIIKARGDKKGVRLFGPAARLGEVGDVLDLMVFDVGPGQ